MRRGRGVTTALRHIQRAAKDDLFVRQDLVDMRLIIIACAILICSAGSAAGQLNSQNPEKTINPQAPAEIRASAGYAEVLLRRTELESNLEELLVSYQEEFPRVKEARHELGLLDSELSRFGKMKASDAPKLTLALGKLIVRRSELATSYWSLSNRYSESHPDVKKAKRKLEIFDAAIEKIL